MAKLEYPPSIPSALRLLVWPSCLLPRPVCSFTSLQTQGWLSIEIDDIMPARWQGGNVTTAFAAPCGGELWVMLLEKAVAKFVGSYGLLVSGTTAWCLQLLLGPKVGVRVYSREKSISDWSQVE